MELKRKFRWMVVPGLLVFFASFVSGVVSATGEEDEGLDPWYVVKEAESIPNMISLLLSYGDFDRYCRCFPRTEDDITGECYGNLTAECDAAPFTTAGTGCRVDAAGGGNANYCTDHNAYAPNLYTGTMYITPIHFSGGSNRYPTVQTANPDPGEFLGFFDWMETVVEDMFAKRIDLVFPIFQTVLCGTVTCMAQMGSDICLIMGDGATAGSSGDNYNDGNVCFREAGTAYGNTNDDIMLWTNRAFAKIYPTLDLWEQTTLRTVVAMYSVRQTYNPGSGSYVSGDPTFAWPPVGVSTRKWLDFPTSNRTGRYSSSGYKTVGSSEVCLEAYMEGDMSGGRMKIYTDALLMKIDMGLMMGENPWTGDDSIFDLCVTEAQMDFKGAKAYGAMLGYTMDCDMEDGEDNSNSMMNLEAMPLLHQMLRDMVNEMFHGSCPGSYHLCAPYQSNVYARGTGCQEQVEACMRNPNIRPGASHADRLSFCAGSGNACPFLGGRPCNVDASHMKWVVNMGNPPIDRWIELTEEEMEAKEGSCTYGILPLDLNNMLNPDQPFSVNMPGYDPLAPTYGTMQFGGQTFDLGVYVDGLWGLGRSYVKMNVDVAIRPRWGEYWGCIDSLEMGLPQYTRPNPWEFTFPSSTWNYGVRGIPYEWNDPVSGGHTAIGGIGDETMHTVAGPSMRFYDEGDYSTYYVSSNGFISVTTNNQDNVPKIIPSSAVPNSLIAPLWSNLDPTPVTVYYEVERITPQWRDMGSTIVTDTGGHAMGGYQWTQGTEPADNVTKDVCSQQAITIPFSFFDYNIDGVSDYIYISSNGFMTFTDSAQCADNTPDPIPTLGTLPNNLIAPLWADLEPYWIWYQNTYSCETMPCPDYTSCTAHQYHHTGSGDVRYREITDDTCEGGDCAIITWNKIGDGSTQCRVTCCGLGNCAAGDTCPGDANCVDGSDRICGDQPDNECPTIIPPPCPKTYDLQIVLYADGHPTLDSCFDINYGSLSPLGTYASGAESRSLISGNPGQGFAVKPGPYTYRFCPCPGGYSSYGGGSMYYYDDTVNKNFIVTWDNMKPKASGCYPAYDSFQAVIEYADTGVDDINYVYERLVGFDPYSVGVENAAGNLGRSLETVDSTTSYRFSWDAPKEYKIGLGISQDFHSEIYQLLHASNFFCWSIDKDFISNLIYDVGSEWGINLSSLGGMDLTQLGEFFRVPSFAALLPGIDGLADPDGYVSLKFVPSGAPSTRTGVGEYVIPNEGILDSLAPEEQAEAGGLKGDYYANPGGASGLTMQNFLFSRDSEDGEIVNYGTQPGASAWPSGTPATYFSVIWSGYLLVPYQTTYTFCGRSDDGHRLLIDNQPVFSWPDDPNDWGTSGRGIPAFAALEVDGFNCGQVALRPGLHPIQYQYYQLTGGMEAYLYWCVGEANPYGISQCGTPLVDLVDGPEDIIPGTYLYSGGASPAEFTGTYDVMAKLPSSRLEVWAPLDDEMSGEARNEMVRLFSVDVMMSIGLDIEYMTEYSKTLRYWGWDSGSAGSFKMGTFNNFARIFFGIKPEVTGVSYAADKRLTRAEMEGAVGSIFATIGSTYLNLVVDTKVEFGGAMFIPSSDPSEEWGLIIRGIYPQGPDSGPMKESEPPLWADNSSGDYMAYYVDIGNDSVMNWDMAKMAMPMVIGMLSPTSPKMIVSLPPVGEEEGDGEGMMPVEVHIQAPSGVFFEDEVDPIWTKGYALSALESRAVGFGNTGMNIRFQGQDSRGGSGVFRYSWRFDGGLWGLPRYSDRTELPRLLEGKHTFEVTAISQDNMVSDPARLDFVIDTQPPRLALQNIGDDVFITNEDPVFVVEASDFQTRPEDIRIAYRIDGGQIVDNGFSKVVSPAKVSPLEHVIEILAQDGAGNVSSIEVEFFVDSGRDSFGCGSIGRGGVSQVGTAIVIILLVTFPIMLILFLKVYYREKEERFKG